jgi:CheY-like chemotaxis protein
MSHEIRTPMNGVLGAAQIGLAHSQDPVAREHLQLIHSSGQTLLAILNDILDFSKIESQQLHLERVPTDLAAVASDSCALLRPGAAAKGLRLELELGDHLPPRILGDPVRLRQILLNLLTNAVKFTSSGAVTLQLSNSHTTAGRQLHIHCRDTGMGMDAETVDRLFTPFTQADASTTRRFGGTGLGLAIVHHLVSLHGGRITCSSRPGVGTTFHLTLPLELADDDGAIAALPRLETLAPGVVPVTPLADSPIANTATTAQRVLLAEDNPVNQRVVRAMLTGLGCQVTVVDHGAAAVEHCLATLPDLVFMDMQMPIMDGLEACRRIRAAEGCSRHTPIVALTANAFDDDRIACREAGMDDFLAKPVDLASLRDLVQRITRPSAG